MSEYKDFSSLPPDKEQQFVVFEKTSVETAKKAKKLGMIISSAFGVLVLIIVLSFDKPKNLMEDDPAATLQKSPAATETEKKEEAPKPDSPTTPATGAEGATTDAPTDKPVEDAPTDSDAAKTDG